MFGTIFWLLIFICLAAGAYYLLVFKPNKDKKDVAQAAPPAPAAKPTQKEEGEYLGRGNPPPPDPAARPLWEFDFAPGYYGDTIKATMGGAAAVTITPDATTGRWDGPNGIVFKKGNQGKARIHGSFGSQATTCTIEFTPK